MASRRVPHSCPARPSLPSLPAGLTLALTPGTDSAAISVACGNVNQGAFTYVVTAANARTGAVTACDLVDGQPGKATCSAGLQAYTQYSVSCLAVSDEVTMVARAQATT